MPILFIFHKIFFFLIYLSVFEIRIKFKPFLSPDLLSHRRRHCRPPAAPAAPVPPARCLPPPLPSRFLPARCLPAAACPHHSAADACLPLPACAMRRCSTPPVRPCAAGYTQRRCLRARRRRPALPLAREEVLFNISNLTIQHFMHLISIFHLYNFNIFIIKC